MIPFFSEGNWHLYEMVTHVLSFTGKARVKISSFSISENAIRSFLNDKENGLIEDMILMFDFTIPKRKFDLMLFALDVFSDIRLTSNHSKVIIFHGQKNNAAIITSQNLTPNPRIECGAIFTDPMHFKFYSDMFDSFFDQGVPFNPYDDETK